MTRRSLAYQLGHLIETSEWEKLTWMRLPIERRMYGRDSGKDERDRFRNWRLPGEGDEDSGGRDPYAWAKKWRLPGEGW